MHTVQNRYVLLTSTKMSCKQAMCSQAFPPDFCVKSMQRIISISADNQDSLQTNERSNPEHGSLQDPQIQAQFLQRHTTKLLQQTMTAALQTSLPHVGARVRKAIGQGYRTQGILGEEGIAKKVMERRALPTNRWMISVLF